MLSASALISALWAGIPTYSNPEKTIARGKTSATSCGGTDGKRGISGGGAEGIRGDSCLLCPRDRGRNVSLKGSPNPDPVSLFKDAECRTGGRLNFAVATGDITVISVAEGARDRERRCSCRDVDSSVTKRERKNSYSERGSDSCLILMRWVIYPKIVVRY